MRLLLTLAVLAPAFGSEGIGDLRIEVEEGVPARVHVRGSADLPDRTRLTLSFRHQRSDTHGGQWKLLERRQVQVLNGGFDKAFAFPGGLPFGLHRVEVECVRTGQYPEVALPPGGIRGETIFKVAFTDDIAAEAKGYEADMEGLGSLWSEMEAAYAPLSDRLQDPAAIARWKEFQDSWRPRHRALSERVALREELKYPDVRMILNAIALKVERFQEDHESMITSGKHSELREKHPSLFVPEPPVDLAGVPIRLAEELAFNVGKKVVEYGYDRATEILSKPGAPGWGRFRDEFGDDLDRMQTACSDLSSGPCKAEMLAVAKDVPALLQAGKDLLAAGELVATGAPGGASALEAVKAPMKKAYKAIQEKIQAVEDRLMGKKAP